MQDRINTFARQLTADALEARALASALAAQGRSPWVAASLDRIATELSRTAAGMRALAEREAERPRTIGEVIDRWRDGDEVEAGDSQR